MMLARLGLTPAVASRAVASTLAIPAQRGMAVASRLAAPMQQGMLRHTLCQQWSPIVVQQRGYYIPRKNWFPWRVRLIKDRQRRLRAKRNLFPREPVVGEDGIDHMGGPLLKFKQNEIQMSVRRLVEYGKWIKRHHAQDAIDRVECLGRPSARPIIKLLKESMEKCVARNMDPQRLYIHTVSVHRGYFVKKIRLHARGKFGLERSPRNKMVLYLREAPKTEFFHKCYILGQVPRSMASDMRLALRDRRVSPQMEHTWSPYLTAASRHQHRQELKWRQITKKFDYFEERRKWIEEYDANTQRQQIEERVARGLPDARPS
eukprot:GEMP01058504.1.p1 GENE.GEMP01058504.1~~GEMP01058504.1.p1  ORF type:complete len:318 (+),score=51.07 GEMP01058504.1:137-1090(+)